MADQPDATPSPMDLDAIGGRYNIPVYRMEEIVALRRRRVSDAEILASLRAPLSDDGIGCAAPIPLTDEQGRELFAELTRLGS